MWPDYLLLRIKNNSTSTAQKRTLFFSEIIKHHYILFSFEYMRIKICAYITDLIHINCFINKSIQKSQEQW